MKTKTPAQAASGLYGAVLLNSGLLWLWALMYLFTEDRFWLVLSAFTGVVTVCTYVGWRRWR